MEKQILKAVEEAYRKGLQDAKGLNDISPFLLTSQIVAHEVANKFCQPLVRGQFCHCTGLMELEKIDAILEKIDQDPELDDIKNTERQLWLKIKGKAINH